MHFSTIRFVALFLFTLLTLSSAFPVLNLESSSDLLGRSDPKTKPHPKPKGPTPLKPKPQTPAKKPKPQTPAKKPKPQTSVKKPKPQTPAAKQNPKPKQASGTAAGVKAGKLDGHVSKHYVTKIKVPRAEDILDSVYQLHRRELGDYLDSRDYYDTGGAGLQVRDLLTTGAGSSVAVLETRNPVEAVAEVVIAIVDIIKGAIQADNDARGTFTQETVAHGREKFPMFNWVVCHTKHETKFAGKEGKDWGHRHEEVDIKIGGTIGYEIYWFKEGTFHRKGDGGYLNWAWAGATTGVKDNGATIDFVAPT